MLEDLDEAEWTDVEVKSRDGVFFFGHRIVLSMHSMELKLRCIQSSRGNQCVVQLPCSTQCLRLLQKLMYRGSVEVDESERAEFLAFIDEFDFKYVTGNSICFKHSSIIHFCIPNKMNVFSSNSRDI